ncbi:Polysaccharide lyase [Trichinella spiralis]|uniref:Polysaccharide lyase n=1 Tax=Trichinella spiralis TaxID=6334 RepID=A0ABR3KUH3_TRISP
MIRPAIVCQLKVIRNAEWAWRDRSRARMLAGSTEVNKIRHNGSLQLPQDKDNQISFVLNRDPESGVLVLFVREPLTSSQMGEIIVQGRADCYFIAEAVVGDYQITNLSLLLNLINSSLPKELSQHYTVH